MAPMSALGHPSPTAPSCVWGGCTMKVITSSATLRATWCSCSLSLHLAEGDVSHSGQSLSPCHPVSPSLSTFPEKDHPASSVVEHEAVIRAEQAGGHLDQVHAPCHIRHPPVEGTSLWGCLGTLQPSVLSLSPTHSGIAHPCLLQGPCDIPWPCSAPGGFPKGHQIVPGPCPTSCTPGGLSWCTLAVPSLMYLLCPPW